MELPDLYILLFCVLTAFFISKAAIPVLLFVSKKKHLFDDGNDHRKLHNGLIPTLGGVAIFAAVMITFSASSFAEDISGYGYFVAASFILFAAGLKDDLIDISPGKKIAAQFLAAALIIFGCGMQFSNLGGVFGAGAVSGWVSIPLTFFTVIVVINALNLIDGIDGLGGSIGVLASLFFGYWFYMAGITPWAVLSFVLAGSICGFLWYNRPPAKIFMGDTGSLIIGFYLAVLAVKFVEYSISEPPVVSWQHAAPVIVAAVLAVPLYDTLRVFILRTLNGRSPFEADKEHVHHHLLRMGLGHGQIVGVLLVLNAVILGNVILFSGFLSNTWLLAFMLSMCILFFPTNRWKRRLLKPFTSYYRKTPVVEETEPTPLGSELEPEDFLAKESLKELEKREAAQEV